MWFRGEAKQSFSSSSRGVRPRKQRGPQKEACQSTNLNRRPCRWRPEVDSQQVGPVSTGVQVLSVKPGLLGVVPIFSVFSSGKELVLHWSSQLLLFRIRVCSLGLSDNEIRLVLDRCCPVPKQRACLPVSSFVLVSVWYMFGGFFCSVPEYTQSRGALGTIPRTGFSGTHPFIVHAVCCWTQSHAVSVTTRAQGAERLPALAQLGFTPGFVSHGKGKRMTASRSSRFRLSSPEGSVFLALLCYFAVGFITLSALVLVKYIIKFLGLFGGFCGSS